MRSESPWPYLPALLALAMAAMTAPAAATAQAISLCSGGKAPAPGDAPDDCAQACHFAAQRKRSR
jgi:hypothetical protein